MNFFRLILSVLFSFSLLQANSINDFKEAKEIFKGCAKCHGKDGKNKAFGMSDAIAGQSVEDLIDSMNFFKDSKFEGRGVTKVMAKKIKVLNDKQIEELANYISNLKK
ncbi:c-type cytochrome [Sulfurospirillum sp. 1307]